MLLCENAVVLHTSYRSLEIWREWAKAGADEFQAGGKASHRSKIHDLLKHRAADRPVIALRLQSMDCFSDRNEPWLQVPGFSLLVLALAEQVQLSLRLE